MDYQIYALKLGDLEDPASSFLYRTGSKEKLKLFFYFWCIEKKGKIILVDTGFTKEMAQERGIKNYLNPVEQLSKIGIEAKSINQIIITHIHYDHFGGYQYFPNAVFYIQEQEVDAWSNKPLSNYSGFKNLIRPWFISDLKKLTKRGKVKLLNGNKKLFKDIGVVLTGGHSPGLQFVTIQTKDNKIVLASDVCHLYENLKQDTPSSIFVNLADSLNALETVKSYPRDIIISGHAPEVLDKFQKINKSIVKIA